MSLQRTVLVRLRDMILRGEFAPGERLAEIQLAERLDASRTPVRIALVTLEQEGLVETTETGGYVVRRFTPREIADAIAVRGLLEGMAARLVAEHGVSRQLDRDLDDCLDEIDRILANDPLTLDHYAAYSVANDRLHGLIVNAAGNTALARAIELNDKLPFAKASAMLPMQAALDSDRQWMLYAHRQHHMLADALRRGQSARAQAIAEEHVNVAQTSLRYAIDRRDESVRLLPGIRLVSGG
ncbi:MAG: GntR family transcriptional regulator [Burkholderiaceae bacterium]